jgi:hypothetical protein
MIAGIVNWGSVKIKPLIPVANIRLHNVDNVMIFPGNYCVKFFPLLVIQPIGGLEQMADPRVMIGKKRSNSICYVPHFLLAS